MYEAFRESAGKFRGRESVSEKGSKGVRLCVCVSVYAVAAVFALLLPTSQSLSQSARSKIDVVCF